MMVCRPAARDLVSPGLMENGYELGSPGSLSAEESNSNNAGSEREGDRPHGATGEAKRQSKNRDAARKSRKKQTERADELHKELQSVEQSNLALKKEIASLKKDLHLYTTALEHHEPVCCLKSSSSGSATFLSDPPSVDSHSGPLQASTQAAAPSLATSSTSRFGLQTLEFIESTSSQTLATPVTSPDPPKRFSPQLLTSSSALPFSTISSPHSLFSKDPTSLTTLKKTKPPLVCASVASRPGLSSPFTAAAQSGKGALNKRPSESANLMMKQVSFPSPSAQTWPSYPPLAKQKKGQAVQGCTMMANPHPGTFRGRPVTSDPLLSLNSSTVQDPPAPSLPVTPQANQEFFLASACAHSSALLPMLTSPSPLPAPQTSSSSLGGLIQNTMDPLQILDLSLSDFLDVNEWILSSNE